MTMIMSWNGQALELFAAADDAIRQIPPAFPLEATVAVNPWLGQVQEDRRTAAARMAKVGAGSLFLSRAEVAKLVEAGDVTEADLASAAAASGLSLPELKRAMTETATGAEALPTVSDLAKAHDGVDWPALLEERIGHWAAAHFDRGQAFWPAPETGVWTSWCNYASRDLTPVIAGLSGFALRVKAAPSDARAAFSDACTALGLMPASAPLYFHRLLVSLSGWAQYARHIGWTAERDGQADDTLFELLTVRLIWEAALLEQGGDPCAEAWKAARAEYALPVVPDRDIAIDAALQEAVDLGAERRLGDTLAADVGPTAQDAPAVQAAFCIDVRSERLRRALESADPQVQTIGFAGFFGLPVRHRRHASDLVEARAPMLLSPAIETTAGDSDAADRGERIHLRTVRAWGRFKRAAVSAFAFVEAAGPLYIGKLLRDGLGMGKHGADDPAPKTDLPLDARVDAAERILRSMSLTDGFAPLVLICGHGASVTNTPHASALQCGACGGFSGEVNARLLSGFLNEREVRAGLRGRGIEIPDQTHFVAGLHDTVSDRVKLFDADAPHDHGAEIARLRRTLETAAVLNRTERAQSLPRGTEATLARRGSDWSEIRPEWGLAGCNGFIAAPRSKTRARDLGGRVFLHDYDWHQDKDAATLELILTAPVVVASWISLQYNGSVVSPKQFGAGNKLLHNVVGGIGVLEGNQGPMRAGLPWQSVHDGEALHHVPSRMVVAVEAPQKMILDCLNRHPDVRALFDNDWLTLVTLDEAGAISHRYRTGGWHPVARGMDGAAMAAA